ncbi:MAG: hypothetical protein JO104_02570 [Candidatus Eremiobacteraeota bacterium]|nr:hypothetical protein [Candidatus Eremiobacteraeota bacterium]
MHNLRFIAAGTVALAVFWGCRSGMAPVVTPPLYAEAGAPTNCRAPAQGVIITICVQVPKLGTQLSVTDSIYGDTEAKVRGSRLNCSLSGSGYLCVRVFEPPAHTLNQIQIGTSGVSGVSGAFPVEVENEPVTRSAIVGGSIASISVVPFHSTTTFPEGLSPLPLGQNEHVWIVAWSRPNYQGSVIIGPYKPNIRISTRPSADLTASLTRLTSSGDAEQLQIGWAKGFTASGSTHLAKLTARVPPRLKASATIEATSGVIYYPVGTDSRAYSPGPVAVVNGDVYFVVNDHRNGGCPAPGYCKSRLVRFTPSTETFSHIRLASIPGVSQLYVTGNGTSNGTLWMATFQPVGAWGYSLPAYRMPLANFSQPQPLPTAGFGEPSGFAVDASSHLWLSSCQGSNCKEDHGGTPLLVKAPASGTQNPQKIALPKRCAGFGYSGFSVGDVAYYAGELYVLGLNDGSAPPARGALWHYSPSGQRKPECVAVPHDFNPSPYFATLIGPTGTASLVFGVGSNNRNFRWRPNTGFYILTKTGEQFALERDEKADVTANHVSALSTSSSPGKVLYYASNTSLDLGFVGLGTYQPMPTPSPSAWNVFPAAAGYGDQSDNGVAAEVGGAWFTADGACIAPKTGKIWNGVCLGHAVYLRQWGALPQQTLRVLEPHNDARFGVIINPDGAGSTVSLHAHSGPSYKATPSPNSACTTQQITPLTFSVTGGGKRGVCQITITEYIKNKPISSQVLVTDIK